MPTFPETSRAPTTIAPGQRGEACRGRGAWLPIAVFALAAVLRLWGLFHDLPWSYYGDELHLVKRAMAMGTGDLNPHWFTKPAGLMYMLLFVFGVFYVAGAASGRFSSPAEFGAQFLADQGPFLLLGRLLVLALGLAAILFTWLIGRRLLRHPAGAFAVTSVVAFLPVFVLGSQYVKEDVPSAAFALVGLWLILGAGESGRARQWFLAGIFLGLSTAIKYYGVLFLPTAWLMAWRAPRRAAGGACDRRVALLATTAAFLLATFLGTPYSFLDPTFGSELRRRIDSFFAGDLPAFSPDNGVVFTYGPGAVPGALRHVLALALDPVVAGPLLLLLAALGMLAAFGQSHLRRRFALLSLPLLGFGLLATTLHAYHPSPRHFAALLPLLVLFAWLGACRLARPLARHLALPRSLSATAILLLAAVPNVRESLLRTAELARLDSRVVATRWLFAQLPRDERILLDDYGPVLPLSPRAAARQLAVLDTLPGGEAFTAFQRQRLELSMRHPAEPAFDVDELGHPWWSPTELDEATIRSDPRHRAMANPLKRYLPPPIAGLCAEGYRFVITNSMAMSRYDSPEGQRDFPGYARFYRELARLTPLVRFDPREFDGKGPVVLVYRLPCESLAARLYSRSANS